MADFAFKLTPRQPDTNPPEQRLKLLRPDDLIATDKPVLPIFNLPRNAPSYRFAGEGMQMLVGSLESDAITGSNQIDFVFGFSGGDNLQGAGGSDRLFGGNGNDLIEGGEGNDFLFGEEGNDVLRGGSGSDRLNGGNGDDDLSGEEGDDRLLASPGFDRLAGGMGRDTADYSGWGQKVTLRYGFDLVVGQPPRPQLQVLKAVATVETVTTPAVVQTVPVLDILETVEVIEAAKEQANVIDFSFRHLYSPIDRIPTVSAPAIDLNLAAEKLSFIPDISPTRSATGQPIPTVLTVQNFTDVIGSFGNDRIVGNDRNNTINGGKGKDVLIGGEGDDRLITAEKDSLTGGAGRDRFEFNAVWASYSKRSGFRPKRLRVSTIEDFDPAEDQLLLKREFEAGIVMSREKVLQYVPFFSLEAGAIAPEQFLILGQGEVTPQTRLIYNDETGELFYRGPEIYAALGEQVQIARLSGAPALTAQNLGVI